MRVVFSDSAFKAVVSEAAEKTNVETGGVFLGCYENETWYVIETIEPGLKAIFQEAYFEYDSEYIAEKINETARMYQSELTLIGLWHKHPGCFNEFTSTDDNTNSEYAKLSNYGAISILVNTVPGFRMTPYHVTWPLKYSKIEYKVGDEFIPQRLLKICQSDGSPGNFTRPVRYSPHIQQGRGQ